jgi:ABC-2 type transport system ATP-binding protein
MSSRSPAISCRGLRKYYDDVKAVDGLDLEVEPGECFGMLGPNGAGKTTTIEILEGLTKADAGDVTVLGRRWGHHDRELRERLGVSLQESRLTEKLTVYETLELFRSFYVRGRSPEQLLQDLQLEEKRDARVGKLSGGQRQRLAVACALAGDPEILFLDEPTTGLDIRSRIGLWDAIETLVAEGTTVLLTTQYLDEADRLADRIAVIDQGLVIAEGTPDELKAEVGGERLEIHLCDAGRGEEAVTVLGSLASDRPFLEDGSVRVPVAERRGTIAEAVRRLDEAGIAIDDISVSTPTLDDVFLNLTGHAAEQEADQAEAQPR